MTVGIDIPINVLEDTPYLEDMNGILREYMRKMAKDFLKDKRVQKLLKQAREYKEKKIIT